MVHRQSSHLEGIMDNEIIFETQNLTKQFGALVAVDV
jgi:hypothetical protein